MPLTLEALESRLTPSTTFRFTDVDGDRVTITSTRGDLAGAGTFAAVGAGQQLEALYLTTPAFQGAAITTVVTRGPSGDGLVNIGRIDATGRDLASVTVKGDLGKIFAGDGDPATPALGSLKARSMGLYGLATQGGTGDLRSDFVGALGRLTVAGDVREATVNVTGKLGPVAVGGSLAGGPLDQTGCLFATDGMGLVTIGGDVAGGGGTTSGVINCTTDMAGVTIGGSLRGGPGLTSGAVFSDLGKIGPVQVGGDIAGGSHFSTGRVFGATGIASVTVGGSLLGGTANDSGRIHSNSLIGPVRITGSILGGTPFTGSIEAHRLAAVTVGGSVVGSAYFSAFVLGGDLGPVRIGRDLVGGEQESGRIFSSGPLASVTVGGSVVGGAGPNSGQVQSAGDLGPVRIGRDLAGGGVESGRIKSMGAIAAVTVGGSVVGGSGYLSGIIQSARDLGPVSIGGDLAGRRGQASGQISSGGNFAALTVGGSVVGGPGFFTGSVEVAGDMGPVSIGGDLAGGTGPVSAVIFIRGDGPTALTVGLSVLGGPAAETGMVWSDGILGPVRIGRDLRGGSIAGTQPTLDSTGYIQGNRIAGVFVGGSVVSGTDTSTGGGLTKNASIRAANDIGPVVVKGSLVGNRTVDSYNPVIISARGPAAAPPPGATTELAIKSLTVGGRVEHARILAGYDIALSPVNGNASIGAVTVGKDWVASSLVAGVRDVAGDGFGTPDDVVINSATDAIVARIASVSIGGVVAGSVSFGDHHGFVAQRVGSFRAGAYVAPLTAGADVIELSPTTGDLTIREV